MLWVKVFKNGTSKICGRQLLKNLKGYGQIFMNRFRRDITKPNLEKVTK